MSEINGPKFSVNQVNYSGIQKPQQEAPQEQVETEASKINDFSDEPSKDGLLDRIRLSLSKHISQRFISEEPAKVIEFSGSTLDEMFRLTETEEDAIIKVDGKVAGRLAKKIEKIAKTEDMKEVILVVPMEIRHMTFAIFSEFINNLSVIAHEELTCETNIKVVETI